MVAKDVAVPPLETAGPSRSLLPIHTLAKGGFAIIARCACDFPPRNSVVKVFEVALEFTVGSIDHAPGTATLFRISAVAAFRRSHVPALVPAGRACVWKFVTSGGHPRPAML